MKQSDRFSCLGVDRRHVRTLVAIAEYAAIGQIVDRGATAVFATYNVVDLMSERRPILGVEAVFAAKVGPKDDFLP
jgi:hypothetical protein